MPTRKRCKSNQVNLKFSLKIWKINVKFRDVYISGLTSVYEKESTSHERFYCVVESEIVISFSHVVH